MRISKDNRDKLISFLRSMQEKDFYDGAEDVAGSLLGILEYQKRGRKVGWRKGTELTRKVLDNDA